MPRLQTTAHTIGRSALLDLRRLEHAHIALWLIKDTCWLLGYKTLALLLALPTLGLALWIVWRSRRLWQELAPNLAVCAWICGNVTWMVGEFFYNDTWRPYAQWFFVFGLGVMAVHYGVMLRAKGGRP